LYQIFIDLFKGNLRGTIEREIRNEVVKIIHKELNQVLATIPLRVHLDNTGVGIF
jgi:uncharacterized FlaG/YvyC family protein